MALSLCPRRGRRPRLRAPEGAAPARTRRPPSRSATGRGRVGSHLTRRRRARSGGDAAPLPPCRPARRPSQERDSPGGPHGEGAAAAAAGEGQDPGAARTATNAATHSPAASAPTYPL